MATTTTDRTRSNDNRRLSRFIATPATMAVASLLAAQAGAAEWHVTPTLDLRETYTDNVRLAPSGAEQSDFVSDISPGLKISTNGPRLKLNASYAFQYLLYANDGKQSGSFHKLNANTKIDLVKDLLAFDGTAAINQQSLSLIGPRATDNYAITDNRATVRTFTASPYLHHDFRGIATSELRYTHTALNTSADAAPSSQNDGVLLSINSDPSFRTLGWGFNYSAQRNTQDDSDAVNSSVATGNLRYALTPHFALTATAGYDKYDYVAAAGAPGPEGRSYSGGFSWRPTERTNLTASIGQRFYGRTYSLDSSIRSRASVWHVSYDENITTTLSEFGFVATDSTSNFLNQLFRSSIPDDAKRQEAVDRFILVAGLPTTMSRAVNYLTNQFFLQKALRGSVAITGAKNTVIFTAYNVSREPQSVQSATLAAAPGSPLTNGDTRQTGLNALWNWRVTALTSAIFSADISKSTQDLSSIESRLKTVRAALTCRLQPKLDGILEVKHTEQASNLAGNTYHENAISAFLSMKF